VPSRLAKDDLAAAIFQQVCRVPGGRENEDPSHNSPFQSRNGSILLCRAGAEAL